MKLYIVSGAENGKENIDGIYTLVSEEGEAFYSHWCSDKAFALGDLVENRESRKEELSEQFGEYQVLYLGDDEMTIEEIVKRNKEFHNLEEIE